VSPSPSASPSPSPSPSPAGGCPSDAYCQATCPSRVYAHISQMYCGPENCSGTYQFDRGVGCLWSLTSGPCSSGGIVCGVGSPDGENWGFDITSFFGNCAWTKPAITLSCPSGSYDLFSENLCECADPITVDIYS
jgi:hypothetical protein